MLNMLKYVTPRCRRKKLRKTQMTTSPTTPKTCLWAGMASPSHTGYTRFGKHYICIYFLLQLHGLNISYNCEICGNFTYKGPKAFQRHFAGDKRID